MRSAVLVYFAIISGVGMPVAARAQDTHAEASDDQQLEAWVLAGVDAGLHERGRLLVAVGSLGGLDADIVLTEVTAVAGAAAQFIGGHAYVNPTARGVPAMSVWRAAASGRRCAGGSRSTNRLLIERRSNLSAGVSTRGRDRVRLLRSPGSMTPVGVFATAEALVRADGGFPETRYQVGMARPAKRTLLEIYWLHRRFRIQSGFQAIGVTAYWRIGSI